MSDVAHGPLVYLFWICFCSHLKFFSVLNSIIWMYVMHMELYGKAILKQFSRIFKMYVLHILQNKWGCHLVWELSVLWFVLIAGVVGISPNHEETKMQVYPGSQPYTHLQYSTPSLVPVSQPQPLISLPPCNIPAATMSPRYPISPNMYTR